jgi:hypothetical protein
MSYTILRPVAFMEVRAAGAEQPYRSVTLRMHTALAAWLDLSLTSQNICNHCVACRGPPVTVLHVRHVTVAVLHVRHVTAHFVFMRRMCWYEAHSAYDVC